MHSQGGNLTVTVTVVVPVEVLIKLNEGLIGETDVYKQNSVGRTAQELHLDYRPLKRPSSYRTVPYRTVN